MKLYTIVGFSLHLGNRIFKTYINKEIAEACMEVHIECDKAHNVYEKFEIWESEIDKISNRAYVVYGYDGYNFDMLGICNSLDSADMFIIEKHEELEKNNIHYPHYDVRGIDL
jgi:hypothetical protein